jgi:hypothetical protein
MRPRTQYRTRQRQFPRRGPSDLRQPAASLAVSVHCPEIFGLSFGLSCSRSWRSVSVRRIALHAQAKTGGLAWTSVCKFGKRVGFTPSRVRIPHPPPTLKPALNCGNAVRIRSARDGVASNIEAASLSSGLSFGQPICGNPAFRRLGAFAEVRRHTPRLTNPLQKRAHSGSPRQPAICPIGIKSV